MIKKTQKRNTLHLLKCSDQTETTERKHKNYRHGLLKSKLKLEKKS